MNSSVAYKKACNPSAQTVLRTDQAAVQAYLVNQYQGGPVPVKTRGDLKWPPAAYRKNPGDDGPTAPIATPKLPKKDYSQFFSQHQNPESHCGYKVAPGTLHVTPEEVKYISENTSCF